MNVIRRLHTYMPLRPLVLPTQARAWEMMAVWIDGWEELFKLIGVASIATWDVRCHSFAYMYLNKPLKPHRRSQAAYVNPRRDILYFPHTSAPSPK
jgi:hypothetical protein